MPHSFELSLKGDTTCTICIFTFSMFCLAFLFFLWVLVWWSTNAVVKRREKDDKDDESQQGNKEHTCQCKYTCPCFCSGTIIWTQTGMPQEGDWPKRERQRDEKQDTAENYQLQKDETKARKRPSRTLGSRDPSSPLQNPDEKPGPSGTSVEVLDSSFSADDDHSANCGQCTGTATLFN